MDNYNSNSPLKQVAVNDKNSELIPHRNDSWPNWILGCYFKFLFLESGNPPTIR